MNIKLNVRIVNGQYTGNGGFSPPAEIYFNVPRTITTLNGLVSLDQMGTSLPAESNQESDEIVLRDAEITKLNGIITDFESKNGLKDLGSLDSQLTKMTKDAESQQEILEYKNQELLAAQSMIESQKAELAQAMIAVGEETGQTSEILEELDDFFEEEVTNSSENISAIIEPVRINMNSNDPYA